MDSTENTTGLSQQEQRMRKLEALQAAGYDPFGQRFDFDLDSEGLRHLFQEKGVGAPAVFAGRLTRYSDFGKSVFMDLQDRPGKMQVYIKKNEMDDKSAKILESLDLGDFIGVHGKLMQTKTGEVSIHAESLTFLTKALEPLPEKFHELNIESKYRQRYLDLAMRPESRKIFIQRSQMINKIRTHLEERGFIEVETPMMQSIAGGAAAKPFITHHNALDMKLYLRIAPELFLKRLLVGGMDRVFEINRNFRNEGISTRHNPEFTMLEAYQAYGDLKSMMDLAEGIFCRCAQEIVGKLKFSFNDREIDLTPPWPRRKLRDLVGEFVKIDPYNETEVRSKAASIIEDLDVNKLTHDEIVNELFERCVEEHLANPVFVTDYPSSLCPLTKRCADDPSTAQRFELFIGAMEMANAYTELNDPIIQRRCFEEQMAQKREDNPADIDSDFCTALEHGMPPAGGIGIGIDRLVMLMTEAKSIRDVILFPLMRKS